MAEVADVPVDVFSGVDAILKQEGGRACGGAAEGRRDLRRVAREGGEGDGREGGPRVCWPIYTCTDRSESLDRRWTVGRSWALIENDPR